MSFIPSPSALLARNFMPVAERYASSVQADAVIDFGPVFLPDGLSYKSSRFDAGTPDNCSERALSVSCFGLSMLPPQELEALLSSMHCCSRFVLFADFKVAERNIEAPACLLMKGLRRICAADSSSFETRGGLEGLLYAERNRFRAIERSSLLGGSLLCILAECLPN